MSRIIAQGECLQDKETQNKGLEMRYTLTDDGTLTISGQGVLGHDVEIEAIEKYTPDGDEYYDECENQVSQFREMDVRRVVIEKGVTGLGNYSLMHLAMTTEVTLSEGLSKIGNLAFAECVNLESVAIPSSVCEIGLSAFDSCKSLREITIPEGITGPLGGFDKCTSLRKIVLPQSLEILPTFYGCESLEEIVFPSYWHWDDHDYHCFSYCRKLKRIIIPEGVEILPRETFRECDSLEYVSLPSTLQRIDDLAFDHCPSLAEIEVKSPLFFMQSGCLCSRDGEVITGINQDEVIIPEGMTLVRPAAFSGRDRVKSLVLPDSITGIDIRAFEGLGITSLTLPQQCEVACGAFLDCQSLVDVVIPEGVKMDMGPRRIFEGCPVCEKFAPEPTWEPIWNEPQKQSSEPSGDSDEDLPF